MKHIATIIFYETVAPEADAKRLKRIERMIRRECLPVIAVRHERIPCKFDDLLKSLSNSMVEIDGLVEERFFVSFQSTDPKKLHELVSWLQAYARYCGIHSRLFQWNTL